MKQNNLLSQYEADIRARVLDLVDEHQDAWQKTFLETKSEQQPLEVREKYRGGAIALLELRDALKSLSQEKK